MLSWQLSGGYWKKNNHGNFIKFSLPEKTKQLCSRNPQKNYSVKFLVISGAQIAKKIVVIILAQLLD